MELRWYQREAVEAAIAAIAEGAHPLVVLPTGAGKSLVLAELARRTVAAGRRVAIVTHRQELLAQDEAAIRRLAHDLEVGVVSAGLGRVETGRAVTLFGVATAYRRLERLEPVDLVVIDEAHLVPPREDAMYRRVLDRLGGRRLGLTATPYRLDSGLLHDGDGALFDRVAYRVAATRLVEDGYLAPLRAHLSAAELDLRGVRSREGDFVVSDLAGVATQQPVVEAAVRAIAAAATARRSLLVFGVSVQHVELLSAGLRTSGIEAEPITGATPAAERERLVDAFRAGDLRALVSCEVLTTGFDAPAVDMLALVRPTKSRALHVQMLGRGMRIAPGKQDCLVLDLAGNVARHGIDDELRADVPITIERDDRPKHRTGERRRYEPDPPLWLAVESVRARVYQRDGENRVVVVYRTTDAGDVTLFLLPERSDLWARARIAILADARRLPSRVHRDAVALARALDRSPVTAILARERPGRDGRLWWDVLAEALETQAETATELEAA